ncbi:MAG: 2-hydroxyacyl-CoA dehydratase, partial [Clostridia bacterium]
MEKVEFTKEMIKDYTILLPNMLPTHFELIRNIIKSEGYNVALLNNSSENIPREGLKYVHNDTCYPALLVIGQMIDALKSGDYDVHKVALMITQTGGGCRASNYIHLLRKALETAGYGFIPVVSLNISGLEKTGGFSLSLSMLQRMLTSVVYGDMLMLLKNQLLPYEVNKGETIALENKFITELSKELREHKFHSNGRIKKNLTKIVEEFSKIEIKKTNKTKVGIVGEIYIKYASLGNNHLEEFLQSQNCEIFVPGLFSFILFKLDNRTEDIKLYGGNIFKKIGVDAVMKYLQTIEKMLISIAGKDGKFITSSTYSHLKTLVNGVIGYGNKMGEGWLLTAEMLELIDLGYENIVCAQPFGCLPNHIVGRGMLKKIKSIRENANIVPIDYDPSATKVNQENRIKLMLAMAT